MIEKIKFDNKIRLILRDVQTSEILSINEQSNLVVTTGKNLVLDALGENENGISYGVIGTGTGTTSAGSTLLESELTRAGSVFTRTGTTGTFSVFFNTSQANGSEIKEVGFFGGDNIESSANTGTMFNRVVLTSGINKTSSQTLTMDLDLTVA